MRLKLMIITRVHTMTSRLVLTALAMFLFLFVQSTSISLTQAQKKSNKSNIAFLTITTTPDSYPIMIDDRPDGETTPNPAGREILLLPGKHTIKIFFPNNNHWSKEIRFTAGQVVCIKLDYKSAGTSQSDSETTPSLPTARREDRDAALVDITYPNGDKLIGNTDGCRQTRLPKVPWWKRVFRRKQ